MSDKPCPKCGHCDKCGRSNAQPWPHPWGRPYPYTASPYTQPVYPGTGGITPRITYFPNASAATATTNNYTFTATA